MGIASNTPLIGSGLGTMERGSRALAGAVILVGDTVPQAAVSLLRRLEILPRVDEDRSGHCGQVDAIERILLADGRARSTARVYARINHRLLGWMRRHCPQGLGRSKFLAFLAEVLADAKTGRPQTPPPTDAECLALRRVVISAVRAFTEKYLAPGITRGLRLNRYPEPVAPAPDDSIGRLYRGANSDSELLLLALGNGCGLRPREMSPLRWDWFLPDFSVLLLPGVGDPVRVDVPEPVRPLLSQCAERCSASPYVLPSPRLACLRPASVRALQARLRRLCKRCGVGREVTLTSLWKAGVVTPPTQLLVTPDPRNGFSRASAADTEAPEALSDVFTPERREAPRSDEKAKPHFLLCRVSEQELQALLAARAVKVGPSPGTTGQATLSATAGVHPSGAALSPTRVLSVDCDLPTLIAALQSSRNAADNGEVSEPSASP